MGVNSLPKTVTRHRRGCDLNPGPTAPESSTLTTRLPRYSIKVTWHAAALYNRPSFDVAVFNNNVAMQLTRYCYNYASRRGGGGIKRYRGPSVCLSVCLPVPRRSCRRRAAALGYRHAGCLQLSPCRPPEMCGLWTRRRTNVDPPRVELPSSRHPRGDILLITNNQKYLKM